MWNGLPWGFVLGQVLHDIFINELEKITSLLIKLLQDAMLGCCVANTCRDLTVVQQDLKSLEVRTRNGEMSFYRK